MSDETPETDAVRPRKKRRWRRLAAWLIVLLVVGRITLAFALEPIARRVAAGFGVDLSWEELDLSLLGGRVEIWRLEADALEGDGERAPLLRVQTLAADVDVLALVRGTLRIRRIEVDGARVAVARAADGSWSFDSILASLAPDEDPGDAAADDAAADDAAADDAAAADDEPASPPAPRTTSSDPISLASPIQVIAARAQDVSVHFRDDAADPPVDVHLTASFVASDVGAPDRRGTFDLVATSPEMLDLLRVHGAATTNDLEADVELDLVVSRLCLKPLSDVLALVGIDPTAERLDARGHVIASADLATDEGDRIAVELEVSGATLSSDGVEAAGLDRFVAVIDEVGPEGLVVHEIDVEGVRGSARQLEDGAFEFAGLALRGRPREREEDPSESDVADEVDDPQSDGSGPYPWSLGTLSIRNGALGFDDLALEPTVEIDALLDELTVGPLSSEAGAREATLDVAFRAPGLIERGSLRGSLASVTSPVDIDVALEVEGIDPVRAAPYLAMAGLEPDFESGTLSVEEAEFDGIPGGGLDIALTKLSVVDSGQEVAAVDRFDLALRRGVEPRITLSGGRATVIQREDRTIEALGLRFGASPTPPRRRASSAPADAPPPVVEDAGEETAEPFEVPAIRLPIVDLQFERLTLTEEGNPLGTLEVGPILATVGPSDPSSPDGRAYSVEIDGRTRLARELVVSARVDQAATGALRVAGRANAEGLNLDPLSSWLELAGVQPVLVDATFDGAFDVAVDAVDGAPSIGAKAGPIRLVETSTGAERTWLDVGGVELESLSFADGVRVGSLAIEAPELSVVRDAEGGVRALGLRVPPEAAPAGDEAATAEDPAAGVGESESTAPSEPEPVPDPGPATADGPAASLGRLAVTGAKISVEDLMGDEAHAFALTAGVEASDVAAGAGAGPVTWTGSFGLDDGTVEASGSVVLDPSDLRVAVDVGGDALDTSPIERYLPPDVGVLLRDAVLAARIEARLADAEDGGQRVDVEVSAVDLRERDAEYPLVALDALRIDVPRFDVDGDGEAIDIDEIAIEGLSVAATRREDGGLRVAFVDLAPPAAAPDPGEATDPSEESEQDARPTAPSPAEAGAGRRAVPRIQIERIDLELASLRISNEAFPDAEPLSVSSRLALREPVDIDIDPDAEEDPSESFGFVVSAASTPGIGRFQVELDLRPFEERPQLDAIVTVREISGEGIDSLLPEVADLIDVAGLADGTFDAKLESELRWRRRGPLDFDVAGGFGAEVRLEDVALRETPDADIALGVDLVHVEARRIVPGTGDVRLSRVEIEMPRSTVRKTPEGFEIAGFLLRTPPESQPESEPTPAPEDDTGADTGEARPGSAPADETAAPVEASAPAQPAWRRMRERGPELRIDEFLVRDIDVLYEDVTAEPAFVVPLELLDVEVRGFSTRALTEPTPIRFAASLGAGDVPLPQRLEQSSALRGVALGVIDFVARSEEEIVLEQRPLFGDVSATGRITLAPYPTGWVRTSVEGFELLGLRGLARQSGVEIGDGVLDSNIRVQLTGKSGGRIDSVSSFSYLKLSEPDGGPISRYLKLPAPLDTVLFVLKNEQGEHRIPLKFDFGGGGALSSGEIATKASAAFLSLVTEALASAPMRAVGTVTDVVGLGGLIGGGDGKPKYAGLTATIEFAPGGTHIGPEARAQIDRLIDAMDEDPLLQIDGLHAFGEADIARAEQLASPETDEAARLVRSLRARRDELRRSRDDLSSRARAQLMFGQDDDYEATRTTLVMVSRDLNETEDSLDRIAELLRPGAEKRRERRTRQAAMGIASTRIDAVRRVLLGAGVPYERFDIRRPRFQIVEPEPPEDGADAVEGAENESEDAPAGRIVLVTKGGTPPKGLFRRLFGWIGL